MQIVTQRPFGTKYPLSRMDAGIPAGSYECSDGEWIYFTLAAPGSLEKVCEITGLERLINDPDFAPATRFRNRHIFYPLFRDAFKSKPCEYWTNLAKEKDLTLVRLHHFADIAEDPQAWENGYVERVEFPNGNTNVMPASPIEMDSCTPPHTKATPSAPGADTVSVLAQLGYSDEQIKAMLEAGAAIALQK